MSRTIALSRGFVAIVDDKDYEWLSQWKWHAVGRIPYVYAVRKQRKSEGEPSAAGKRIFMHSVVVSAINGYGDRVDHLDHNTLNNRHANLRMCTHGLNLANQRSVTGSSQFKGVYWDRDYDKWRARIAVNNKKRHLGRYSDEEDAAHAYDEAAYEAWGTFAYLNFPRD